MREILFRGKRTDCEAWVEGDLIQAFRGNQLSSCSIMPNTPTAYCWKVIPETVGQFTGLTDKNGMRIFEGDLIRSTETGETAIVQWFSEHSAFMIWCKTSNQVGFLYECEKSIIEVIGNIHDNPELIGGEE